MKKKILIISDHAQSPSGVGVQTNYLVKGLLEKKDMTFIQLGAAIKHSNYDTVKVCDDFLIKPINGFGNKNLLRSVLLNEKPDALIIFSDPRFFEWLFEIEDEVKQVCPILWWHVWDNEPYPDFNDTLYDATDAINCHSYLTYNLCSKKYPEKTRFIPHAFPQDEFFRLSIEKIKKEKERILGKNRKDNFVCLWMNRNCKRKRPADVLLSWKYFIDMLSEVERKNVTLLLHTDPNDKAGQNLIAVAEMLGITATLALSTEKLSDELINTIHNISDVCINISYNEGFGLTTLQSMQVGNPIIATKTGGLYRQVVDFDDKSQNGVALEPRVKSIAGSQNIPYIYEDYVDCHDVAEAIFSLHRLSPEKMHALSVKVEKYAKKAFDYEKTIDLWYKSIHETIQKHNKKKEFGLEIVNFE